MPTIFKRPDSRFWQIRYLDRAGRRKTISSGLTDKREAQRRGRAIEDRDRQIRLGEIPAALADAAEFANRPIEEHLAAHLEADERRKLHPRHIASKGSTLRRFFEAERIRYLGDIDAKAVERHMRSLVNEGVPLRSDGRATKLGDEPTSGREEPRKQLSARTANALRRDVLRFLNWCVEDGRLAAVPFPSRSVPTYNEELDRRRERRDFTEAELDRLLDSLGSAPRANAYRLAVLTGLRRGELAALRWSDVELEADEPHLRLRAVATKAKRGQSVPLHPSAVAVLEGMRPSDGDPSSLVVDRVPTAQELYRDLAAAGIQRMEGRYAVRDAGGRILDFHSFRGTIATLLANRGVAPLHLKRIMRHASIETTDRHYAGIRLDDLGREIERLGPIARPYTETYTSSAPDFADSCETLRATGTDNANASRSEAVLDARLGDDSRGGASKRVKGLEPSTFSLGSKRLRADSSGNPGDSRPTVHRNVHLPRGGTGRRALLGAIYSALADLPDESLREILQSVEAARATPGGRRSG